MNDDDLRSLAGPEPSAELDARVRRLAAVELSRPPVARWRAGLSRAATRVVVPGVIVVTVVGYLHWAVASASALYR